MPTLPTEIFLFITSCHPERCASSYALASKNDSGSHFYFFQKGFWFFFLSLLYFYFFHKNYYYFTKGKEPARSPKPAVSLPLNPSLLGHGLRRCLKNLPASEIEVSSVSYEQIRVALFFFKIVFDSYFLSLLFKFWRLAKPSKIGLCEAFSFAFLFFLLYKF